MNNNNQTSSVLDVLSGNESVKIDINLSWTTIAYVLAGAVLVGLVLILAKKYIR